MKKLYAAILMFSVWGTNAFAQKPVLDMKVIAYIEQKTVDYYGGLAAIQDSIRQQLDKVNATYNAESGFTHTYNFNAAGFRVYKNTNPQKDSSNYFQFLKPIDAGYNYRIVYDVFNANDNGIAYNGDGVVNFFYNQNSNLLGHAFSKMNSKVLAHELGHARGQLDIYAGDITADRNLVDNTQSYAYTSDYYSIMNNLYNESKWDPISIAIFNKSAAQIGPVAPDYTRIVANLRSLFTQNVNIRVKDANGTLLSNAQVYMYAMPFYSARDNKFISNTPTYSYTTTSSGQISFAMASNNPFGTTSVYDITDYAGFFVKVVSNGVVKYNWLSINDVIDAGARGLSSYTLDFTFPAGTTQPANILPTIVTVPAGGQVMAVNHNNWLIAGVKDVDGDLSQATVKFYVNGTFAGNGTWEPYPSLRFSLYMPNATTGEFTCYATITDNKGATVTSPPMKYWVYGNEAVKVNIKSPVNNASYPAGQLITFSPSFTGLVKLIEKVEYYDGSTLIGTSTTIPFNLDWSTSVQGAHSITAKAYDGWGLTNTSSVITLNITAPQGCPDPQYVAGTTYATGAKVQNNGHEYQCTVGGWCSSSAASYYAPGTGSAWTSAWTDLGPCGGASNIYPTVTLTAPANNASFAQPATVNITATAADQDGTISKVEFYNGATLLNSDATSPYSYSWTGVAAGTYAITAKAYDNLNATTTSTVANITVTNQLPSVTLTAPTVLTYSSPANVSIAANASDADGTITKVEFYQGTTLLNTDVSTPFAYTWSGVTTGNYAITAKAYDNNGATNVSAVVNITVGNQSPTVSLTSPTNNASVAQPATVNIAATASDADGSISKVEFYQGTTLLNTDATSPYSYSWTGVTAGSYAITAKAYDNLNAVTTSTVVNITVTNQLPAVSLTAPTVLSYSAPANVSIAANASDADGSITKVEFYQGSTLLNTDASSPYSYSWTSVAAGAYAITAKAYDNNGGTKVSTVINITVSGGSCTAPQWVSSTAYTTGNVVQYNGIKYIANWWTQGEQPDLNNGPSGSGKSWTSQGTCTSRIGAVDNAPTILETVIFPNPSNGTFTIIAEENTSALILNSLGENVSTLNLLKGNNEINNSLPRGVYLLNINNKVVKLVIE